MQFYELTITTALLKDMHFTITNEKIANIINQSMFLDEELAKKHIEKGFKNYVFSSFYPVEKDKEYKSGRIYVFRIRSLEESFISKIRKYLLLVKNEDFKIIATEIKTHKQRFITELYTITPALATIDNKHWVKGDDISLLIDRMQGNLEKKYKEFFGEALCPKQSFIQRLEVVNQKPFSYKYKNTKLLANKFKIFVNEDEVSQTLAFIALATGLLEKNSSAGCGFCTAR